VDPRHQGVTLLTAVVAFIATIVIIQLWLAGAAVEAFLGGELGVLAPAALASAALVGVNVLLLRFGTSFDRRLRGGADDG
jgi:hypothetical protein